MAVRYNVLYDENGDVIDPTFYVQNMSTTAGEFNVGLDRDNFAQGTIVTADVNTSTYVFNFIGTSTWYNSDTPYATDRATTSWQGGAGNDAAGIGNRSFTLPQECHLRVYWSGTWSWGGAYSWAPLGARPTHTDTFDTVRIRVTVDGVEVIVLGPFEDGAQFNSAFGCGSIQLDAGTHEVRVEAECKRMVAQTDVVGGSDTTASICTNTCTFNSRSLLTVPRVR